MKYVVLTASLSLLALTGCRPAMTASTPSEPQAAERVEVALPAGDRVDVSAFTERLVGDYVVYRFSGSYRDTPITLSQTVVSHEAEQLIMDVTINRDDELVRLRLRIDDSDERRGQLLSVARFEGDVQRPFGIAAYEQLMNEIVLTADDNLALVEQKKVVVDVGGQPLEADKTAYRVRVGADTAIMETLSAAEFAWGDIGGEIRTVEGKLLYKAEVVEIGNHDGPAVAAHEEFDLLEGLDHLDE